MEVPREIGAQCNQDRARPQLRNPVCRRVEQLPAGLIAELAQAILYRRAVSIELWAQEAPDVLEHYRARFALRHETKRFREEVALIFGSELLSGDGERRAGDASGQEIHLSLPRHRLELAHVPGPTSCVSGAQLGSEHLPPRPVCPERLSRPRVDLYDSEMRETRLL